MLLKEESIYVLSILKECDNIQFVEDIVKIIGESTAASHKNVYVEAIDFFKSHGRFPDLAYFKKSFPEISFGAEFTGEYSLDIIIKFLTELRKEVTQVKAQELLSAGEYAKAANMCNSIASIDKEIEQYTSENAIEEYNKFRDRNFNAYSGIKQIDDTVKGFSYGHLVVIAAPPACFKTTLAQNIAYYSITKGFKVAFLSFELMKRNIMANMISRHSALLGKKIPAEHINKQLLDHYKEYDKYIEVSKDFRDKGYERNLFIVSPEDLTVWESPFITRLFEKIDDKMGGLDMVFLDYAQVCKSFAASSGVRDATDFVNNIIRHLSLLAKTYKGRGLIIFLLSQINREGMKEMGKNNGSKGMGLSSLAEFNALEREASVVMFLHASESDKAARYLKMKVSKNRYGPVNEEPIHVSIDPETGVIGEHSFSDILNIDTFVTTSQSLDSYDISKDIDTDGLFNR